MMNGALWNCELKNIFPLPKFLCQVSCLHGNRANDKHRLWWRLWRLCRWLWWRWCYYSVKLKFFLDLRDIRTSRRGWNPGFSDAPQNGFRTTGVRPGICISSRSSWAMLLLWLPLRESHSVKPTLGMELFLDDKDWLVPFTQII